MPLPPPPIPTQEWDDHQTEQYTRAQADTDAAFAAARAAQERADAAQAADFAQRADAHFRAAVRPVADAHAGADFAAQADASFAQATAPLRAARQRVQQGTGAMPGGPGPPEGPPPSPAGGPSPRSHSPGVEANRAAVQAAFGDLGPAVVENMLAIQDRESGGNPNAVKTDGIEDSHGAFQINARAHPQLAARYDLHDPVQNARAAREVYDRQGYGAWYNASNQLGLLGPASQDARGGVGNAAASPSGSFDLPPTPGADRGRFARTQAVGQFEQGLPYAEAASICGPVAALAFVQANGRNPSLAEVRALATRRGWTAEGGMNGVANEQALLSDLGVKSRLDTNPDVGEIAADAASGNPVIISTARHYYYASAVDHATGKLFVGKTGEARRGGGSWMSAQQIASLDGGINGALFVDNPQSSTPSVAAASGDTSGDRPPSEFEQPSAFGPGADLATGLAKGYTGQPSAVVDEGTAEQRSSPDRPAMPMEGILNVGPFGMRTPTLPPVVPPNLAPPDQSEQQRVLEGRAPIQDTGELVGKTAGFIGRQVQSQPGAIAEAVMPGHAAEETVRAQEARGGTGGGVLGSLARGAGAVGGDAGGHLGDDLAALRRRYDEITLFPTDEGFQSYLRARAPALADEGAAVGRAAAPETPPAPLPEAVPPAVAPTGGGRPPPIEPPTATGGPPSGAEPPRRVPIWQQPLEDVAPLEPVVGTRPGEGLAASTETAGRATPPRVPTGFGGLRAPLVVEGPLTHVERALARPEVTAADAIKAGADRLIREAYDRNYPLRELDALAGTDPLRGAHASAQVVSGAIAAGEDNVRRFVVPVLNGLGRDVEALKRYWVLRASEDVAARNPASRLPGGIEGPGGVQRGLKALEASLGPERFRKVDEALTTLTGLNDELRLKPLLQEGYISTQQYTDLKVTNPHYLPFHRYEYATDSAAHLIPGGGAGLGPSSANIGKRTAGGSTLALDRPVERWMADMINVQQLVSGNKARRAIVEGLQAAETTSGQKLVVVANEAPMQRAGGTTTTRERGVIRFFDPADPGVQKVANVPEIYATIAKGLEAEPANAFMKIMSIAATPLRMGATTLSLSFLPRNIARDLQSAYVKEGIKAWSPELLAGWKAAIAKNADFSEAAAAGALQSGLLESRRTEDVLARAQQLRGIQVTSARDAVLLLPRLVGKSVSPILRLNEIAEQAPRLATFIKARGEGASSLEAAVRARDVTVDFSKSGNFVRMMNQMVPFLNARVQGAANTVRLFRTNPAQASARVVAPAAFASTVAYLWNQRFASADTIPSYEWDRSWIFILGEGTQNADPRQPDAPVTRFPVYAKIPKGDAASIASAPVELMLRLAFQQGDRSVVEHVIQAAGAATRGLSPIDPTGSGLQSLISPPLATTAASTLANYDFFRGRPIVPAGEADRPKEEQYGPDTSSAAVALGRRFGVSPRMLDYAIKSYTGGAGGQGLWMLDLALGAVGYDPTVPGEARLRPRTPTESAMRAPGVSGLVGAANTEQRAAGRDHFQAAVTETQRAFNETPDARRLGVSFGPVSDAIEKTVLTPEERIAYQRRSAELAAELVDRVQGSGTYTRADDDRKRKILQDTLEQARKRAAVEILRDIPVPDRRERRRAS